MNMICKHVLLITFLTEHKLILLHTVKWFQALLCITNNSIKYQSFVYKQLSDETVLFLAIQFSISHLFTLSLNVKQFYFIHRYGPDQVLPLRDYNGPRINGNEKVLCIP